MRHQNTFRLSVALLSLALLGMALLLAACTPSKPDNPPVEIVATPQGDIELVEAFATYNPMLLDSGTPVPNNFPPGVDKVYLGIKFKNPSPDVSRFKMDYGLTYKGVDLETEFDSQPANWTEQGSGAEVIILPIRRKDGQAYSDGPYQAKLIINGQLIALLNFTIGAATPAP